MVAVLQAPVRIRLSATGRTGRQTGIEVDGADLRSAILSVRAAEQRHAEMRIALGLDDRRAAQQSLAYSVDQARLARDVLAAFVTRHGGDLAARSTAEDIGDALDRIETEYQRNGRARYERLEAAGLCQTCAVAPRHPGSPLCWEHREKQRAYRTAKASTARKPAP